MDARVIKALGKVAATERSRYELNTIRLDRKAGKLHAVVTDGRRLAVLTMPKDVAPDLKGPVMVPLETLKHLPKGKLTYTAPADAKGRPGFANEMGGACSFVPADGQYPDHESVIPDRDAPKRVRVVVDAVYLRSMCDVVIAHQKAHGHGWDNPTMELSVSTDKPGSAAIRIDATCTGDDTELICVLMPITLPEK